MILKRGDAVASPESSTRSFRRDPQHAGPRSSAVTAEAASRQPDCEFKEAVASKPVPPYRRYGRHCFELVSKPCRAPAMARSTIPRV